MDGTKLAKVKAGLERDTSVFSPEVEGDEVVGIVIEKETRQGQFGEYLTVVLETEDEDEVTVYATGDILSKKFTRIEIGDYVGVRYLGLPNRSNQVVSTATSASSGCQLPRRLQNHRPRST
ncbi:MAG: hypothetical protein ABR529_06655 [Actinomycetota bacterium]